MLFITMTVLLVIFPPNIEFFKKSSEYAGHLMIGLLALSFLLLMMKQTRLMVISMVASALLAFFLKMASNTDFILPAQNTSVKIKVAHFNLTSFNSYNLDLANLLGDIDPDVLSFQEYTPDWDNYLPGMLFKSFPFIHKSVRIDPYGMAIFSKIPIEKVETFSYGNIPNINISLDDNYNNINIISSYISPSNLNNKYVSSQEHFLTISNYIDMLQDPVITIGDFNHVYWSKEIIEFREKTELKNSRRNNPVSSLRVPYDHIFYSKGLECIQFADIKDDQENHLGITGTYQLKSPLTTKTHHSKIGMIFFPFLQIE